MSQRRFHSPAWMWYDMTIIVGDFNVTLGYIFADTLRVVHDLCVCLTPAPVGVKCHWRMSMNKYTSADDKACFKFTSIFCRLTDEEEGLYM